MTKKNLWLTGVALIGVIAIYYHLYKDSFAKPNIQIFHTIRPSAGFRRGPAGPGDGNSISFGLGKDYKITSIKVIPVGEIETNKFPHPIWELISDSNSVPTRVFSYGIRIRGMHPSVKGAVADPLIPNVPYRLLVQAGSVKGEHDFKISEESNLSH